MLKLFYKRTKDLNLILCGLYLFYIGHLCFKYLFKDEKWAYTFSVIGILMILYGFVKKRKTLLEIDVLGKIIFFFYISICLVNFFIGLPLLYFEGRQNEIVTDHQTIWFYLMGLSFLLPIKTKDIIQIIRWSMLYALTSILFCIFFFNDFYIDAVTILQSMIGWDGYYINRPQEPVKLLIPIASFLVFYKKFPIPWKLIIIIAIPLAIVAAVMAGRRSASSYLPCYILIAVYINLLVRKSRWYKLIIVFVVIGFVLFQLGGNDFITRNVNKKFVIMSDRISEDTRKNVEVDFYKDMKSAEDWICGRGMTGTYKSIQLSQIDKLHRRIVETGYLNMILHGGLLMLVPYVLFLFCAFLKGYFYSNNYFVKTCSLIILYQILLLYPHGQIRLSLEVFLLFVFARICYSFEWRNYDNRKINEKLACSIPDL